MAVVFAAFAAERVLSMAVVTPGGTGVVEIGVTGMLVAFGVDPATAAASVLLYRAFIVGLEIPTGGAALVWWLTGRRRTRRLRDNPESARPLRRVDLGTSPDGGKGGRGETRAMVISAPLSRIVKVAASMALGAAIVVWAVPRAGGVGWGEIGSAVAALSPWQVLLLAGVWLAGLWVHTLALTAAMPGLSSRRALFLNLTGSSVSNLLPLGGAAGTVANYSMSRAWGFTSSAFARWALVTNIWDTLAKLALPGVALCWLAVAGVNGGAVLSKAALVGGGLLLVALLAVRLLTRGDAGARALGRTADRLAGLAGRRLPTDGGYAEWAVRVRRDSADLIASSWGRLTVGKAAYALAQAGAASGSAWARWARPPVSRSSSPPSRWSASSPWSSSPPAPPAWSRSG